MSTAAILQYDDVVIHFVNDPGRVKKLQEIQEFAENIWERNQKFQMHPFRSLEKTSSFVEDKTELWQRQQ